MRAQSPKRRRENVLRAELQRNLFRDCEGRCLMGTPVCTASCRAVCLHERRKRSAGGSIVSARNCVPSCLLGNGWVEDNPALASVTNTLDGRSLVVREGHPEWTFLGRRAA